jgi:nitroimidazol reductase NimA-like FMN-containing flavoprotein (pyridoxamine 5'-phosphate oxidase superfamily)
MPNDGCSITSNMTDSSDRPAGPPSERVRVRRIAALASYHRSVIDTILDAATVGHLGVVGDDGQPFVLPVACARLDDEMLIHGSVASRLLRSGAGGAPVCLTVTLVDGVIVARSLFESSMRYRSVVVVGRARDIDDRDEKLAALMALSDHLIPGRRGEVRATTEAELRQTKVFGLPLDEASAKVNNGWPDDPAEDVASDAWAGVVPLTVLPGAPVAAPDLRAGIEVPDSVRRVSGG